MSKLNSKVGIKLILRELNLKIIIIQHIELTGILRSWLGLVIVIDE